MALQKLLLASALWVVVLLASGCPENHNQSALHPASGEAREIARVWWLMFWQLSAIFVLVLGVTGWAVLGRRSGRQGPPGGGTRFFVIAGIFLPLVTSLILFFHSLSVGRKLQMPESGLTVEVTGHQWWWEVRYPEAGIVTANEIYVPAGEPVRIELRSADVVHSFWVPNLHGKMDAVPGVGNTFWIHPEEPGKWRGQCAEFCGRQHAWMAFWVVALPPDEFRQWVDERREPPPPPEMPQLASGKEAFFRASCHACHAIRGTEAGGLAGPDLTHIGSRLTLGAGIVPNNRGNLMGWIANPQEIKPGNLMPRTFLEAEELQSIADYLESLE